MNGNLESKFAQRYFSQTPFARSVVFVAIVWSIAGAFLTLEFAWPELLSRSIRAGWLAGELAMPTQKGMPATLVCRQEDLAGEAATADVDPVVKRQARFASWMLGQRFGFAVAMANGGFADAQTAPVREDLQRWAAMLRLPTPAALKFRHVGNQSIDFGNHLEADPQCVAARLTRRYGPRYGYLYKFGAVVGYAMPARAQNVSGLFALEIQLYGRKAGIPDELWKPMTFDSPVDLPGADPREQVFAAVQRLTEHIAGSQ
jgi:hypothetical protein